MERQDIIISLALRASLAILVTMSVESALVVSLGSMKIPMAAMLENWVSLRIWDLPTSQTTERDGVTEQL